MHYNTNKIPDDVLELLPWAAKGNLTADDQTIFDAALVTYPELKTLLNAEMEMITLVSADKSLLDKSSIAAPEQRVKSVLNMIDAIETEQKIDTKNNTNAKTSVFAGFKDKVLSLFVGQQGEFQFSRVASFGVLAIAVAVLVSVVSPTQLETSEFTPASAQILPDDDALSVGDSKNTMLIGFEGSLSELSNNVVFKGKQLKIENPGKDGMFFQVHFPDSMSKEQVKQTLDALTEQEKVWFAGEAF